ncbi:TPA: hypothetical protein EYP38_01240, partial [Candidatus Micrarchaeota archaeon]|nr:hypothetical protein [Candidatus Micrarchaeota archaeon]
MTASWRRFFSGANRNPFAGNGGTTYSPSFNSFKPSIKVENVRVLQTCRERATFWEARHLLREIRRLGRPTEADEEFFYNIGVPPSTMYWLFDREPEDRVGISLISLRMASLLARDRSVLPSRARDTFNSVEGAWTGDALVAYPAPFREMPNRLRWYDQHRAHHYSVDTSDFAGREGIALVMRGFRHDVHKVNRDTLHFIYPSHDPDLTFAIENFPQTSCICPVEGDDGILGEHGDAIELFRKNGPGVAVPVRDLREPPNIVYLDIPPHEEMDVVVELPDEKQERAVELTGALQRYMTACDEYLKGASMKHAAAESEPAREEAPEPVPEFSRADVRGVIHAAVGLVSAVSESKLVPG